ncbi:MAG: hypothetical protein D6730_11660 [Bacteroidetes bacterium]|nr:MAG: hypothetical protein D6730_11660 [Bacteroidota bacterium]
MSIEIKDVVALTGSPGLYRIVKADDKAIVVESLAEKPKRQLVKGNMLVSKIADISIYTDDESEALPMVFQRIREKYGQELPVTKKSSRDELMNFLGEVLPNYDRERVYPSNVKKLLSWYKILTDFEVDLSMPEKEADDEGAEAHAETAEDAGEQTAVTAKKEAEAPEEKSEEKSAKK